VSVASALGRACPMSVASALGRACPMSVASALGIAGTCLFSTQLRN